MAVAVTDAAKGEWLQKINAAVVSLSVLLNKKSDKTLRKELSVIS